MYLGCAEKYHLSSYVCDEFFSLPLFPPMSLCNEGTVNLGNAALNNGSCYNRGYGCGC